MSGELKERQEGLPEVFLYTEGDTYEGTWSSEGKKDGLGKITFKNGTQYEGIFRQGVFHSFGVLTFEDGTKYEGEFFKGKFHGFGVYSRSDGMKYEGRFSDGAPRGAGLITFQDGSHGNPRQEGYFDDRLLVKATDVSTELIKARKSAERARTCKVGGRVE